MPEDSIAAEIPEASVAEAVEAEFEEAPPSFDPPTQVLAPPAPPSVPTPPQAAPFVPVRPAASSSAPVPPASSPDGDEYEYAESHWYDSGPWGPVALVLAILALLVAVGVIPILSLPKHSVGSAQIRPHSVSASDLTSGAKPRTVAGPQGPRGPSGPVGPTGPPGPAGSLKVSQVNATGNGTATATCPAKDVVVGGGASVSGGSGYLSSSAPSGTAAWTATAATLPATTSPSTSSSSTSGGAGATGAQPSTPASVKVTAFCATG